MAQTDPQSDRRWFFALIWLVFLGATLGVALDGIHTHFGATRYTAPVVWRMAWWTPLLFGAAFPIGLLLPLADGRAARRTGQLRPPPRRGAAALAMGLFVTAYFLSVAPLAWPLVAGMLAALFVVGYGLCDRSRAGLGIAIGAALGGPLVEFLLIRSGTFLHLQPVFFGLPGWLPFLYLTAAVALTTLARWLVAN